MVIVKGTVTLPATRQVTSSLGGSNHSQTVNQFEQDINLMSSNLFDKFVLPEKTNLHSVCARKLKVICVINF